MGPIEGTISSAQAHALLAGEYEEGWTAIHLGSGGDLNADGIAELLIGGRQSWGAIDAGVVYIVDLVDLF